MYLFCIFGFFSSFYVKLNVVRSRVDSLVIDALLLNYVHIMLFIVCVSSGPVRCLQMHIPILNVPELCTKISYQNVGIRDVALWHTKKLIPNGKPNQFHSNRMVLFIYSTAYG